MKIAVIGGGASGLVAAIAAKQKHSDVQVDLYEKNDRIGKKILATGNGRCNLTNVTNRNHLDQFAGCYHNAAFVKEVFSLVPPQKTDAFFDDLGLITVEESDGYVYPFSRLASSVVDVLKHACMQYQIQVHCNERVVQIKPCGTQIQLHFETKPCVSYDRVIVCVGGLAGVQQCDGYQWMQSNGLRVITPQPSLVPLRACSPFLKGLSGVRTSCEASLLIDGDKKAVASGEVLFRDYGLSGIVIFQLSHTLAHLRCAGDKRNADVQLNLLPNISPSAFPCRQGSVADIFCGVLHRKLAENIILNANLGANTPSTNERIQQLIDAAKHVLIKQVSLLAFDRATVTAGGIDVNEIDAHTMQVKKINGLFVTGETVDVAAPCGGYNLQWAWSSGYLAGSSI